LSDNGNPKSQSKDYPIKVDRNVYPRPEYRFPDAKIGLTFATSEPDFPKPLTAPKGSPNIVIALLDDIGYGVLSTFGGLVESPTADRLAKAGLRYCQFHTTALCSPTRAALLTGRNHHSVATGVIQEQATGYPGYCGIIPKSCATVGELLKQNGYATGWWGKNHNVPDNQTSQAGPFDNWPTNQGFDYFYGFIGGETDQFYPSLVRGTMAVEPDKTPEEGYHFTKDITQDCIAWMQAQKAIAPDRPFFAYFATGAGHAPHQPPAEWRGRHAGKFDMGWDEYRKIVWKRQLELGVIPKGTKLTERPKELPAWDGHSDTEKRAFSRLFENYADFCEHADHAVGELVDAIDAMGQLDNTIFIYIIGDNGCSAEGTLSGTINEIMTLNGMPASVDQYISRIDEIGKPGTAPHYPAPWAWAGDTPFQWTKQVASHFGGTRNPMIISWPERIKDAGGTRFQFHHSIDVLPTLLEVVGIAQPSMVNGVPQRPIEGVGMAYTFQKENATAPSTRYQQYFEMFGNRALYSEGWIACCRHGRLPWQTGSFNFDDDTWELYNIADDFSESENLASKNPKKVRELQDLFMADAAKYNILPLDDRFAERMDVTLRPSWFYGRKHVTFYPGMIHLPEGSAPKTTMVNHTITVPVEIQDKNTEGVLACVGGDGAGWALYIKDQRLVYYYNFFGIERTKIVSTAPLKTGNVELKVEFTIDSPKLASPATVRLFADGKPIGEGHIPKQVPVRFGVESMDVGADMRSPVSDEYPEGKRYFPFTGKFEYVRFDFDGIGHQPSGHERLKLATKMD
jgi:arylsulfatase A-like enzyme